MVKDKSEGKTLYEFNVDVRSQQIPSTPSIQGSSSVNLNENINMTITRGRDENGKKVKIECSADSSNLESTNPFISSFDNGGSTVDITFIFNSIGVKKIVCKTVNKSGLSSEEQIKEVDVVSIRRNPEKPIIVITSNIKVNTVVTATVRVGEDPNNNRVQAHCWADSTSYSNSSPYKTSFIASGSNISQSVRFTFSSIGTKNIYCKTVDINGHSSEINIRQVNIITSSNLNRKPNLPNIKPDLNSVDIGKDVSVNVTISDPDRDKVKLKCYDNYKVYRTIGLQSNNYRDRFILNFSSGGTKIITCKVTDEHGLSNTDNFSIQVKDNTSPVPSSPKFHSFNHRVLKNQTFTIPIENRYMGTNYPVTISCWANSKSRYTKASPSRRDSTYNGEIMSLNFSFNAETRNGKIYCEARTKKGETSRVSASKYISVN